MLGELTREEEPDSSLDFTGGDRGSPFVVSKTAGLSSTMPQQHTFFKQFFFYFFFLVEMVNLGLVYVKINLITLDHSKN